MNNFEYYRGNNAIRRRYLSPEDSAEILNHEDEMNERIGVCFSAIFCLVVIIICIYGILYADQFADHYKSPTYIVSTASQS